MSWSTLSFEERLVFLTEHAAKIYVRVEVEGAWQSLSLADLGGTTLLHEVMRLVARDVMPTRLVT